MSVAWQLRENVKVLVIDYRGNTTEEQMLSTLAEASSRLIGADAGVRVYVDMSGTLLSPEYMRRANEMARAIRGKIKRGAIVGMEGLKGIALRSYKNNLGDSDELVPFEKEEDAWRFVVE